MIELLKTIFENSFLPAWIEALSTFFAAFFALLGLRFAWNSLKKDISDQQTQISALTGFTKALGEQTEALTRSTNIDSQILDEMRKHFFENARIAELQQEKEKIKVMPDIQIRLTGYSIPNYTFAVENKGFEEARNLNLSYSNVKLEDLAIQFIEHKERLLKEKDGIGITIRHVSHGLRPLTENMGNFNINFEDIYGNKYFSKYVITNRGDHEILIKRLSQEEVSP